MLVAIEARKAQAKAQAKAKDEEDESRMMEHRSALLFTLIPFYKLNKFNPKKTRL